MVEHLAPGRARWIKVRFGILVAALFVASVAVGKGAWDLGVVRRNELRSLADDQYKRRITLPARRGMITDRHGEELAVEVEVDSVYANAKQVEKPGAAAPALASALSLSEAAVRKKLYSNKHFIWIKRRVTPEEADKVRALGLTGVALTKESKRFYPSKGLASHVLGYAGIDSKGLEGVELEFEEQLKGQRNAVMGLRDARGRVVFADSVFGPDGVVGNTVELTIDRTLQHIAERELENTIRTFNAKAGHVIIMDPKTGEIYALANYPDFNANVIGHSTDEQRRNRAVLDVFEPGSTFKVFTLAAALNSGAIHPEERIFCERGLMTMGDTSKVVIHDDHRDGLLTPAQCLKRSSNICFAKMALKLGKLRLYNYVRRFGFGEATQVQLPFESMGKVRHFKRSREVDAAMMAFGQGVGVTGIQIATALAAVANGGVLMRPLLVRRVVGPDGETLRSFAPKSRRRVISRYTARLVADIMTSVTEEGGTGVEGALDGFLVAGKTGTAQKASGRKGYDKNKWIASFIGFVPAQNPRLVISVVIDEPLISYYGGTVAAPTLRRIADQALKYLGVSPKKMKRAGTPRREVGEGISKNQPEDPAGEENSDDSFDSEGEAANLGPNQVLAPDLTGLSMKQVMDRLAVSDLRPMIQGTGIAGEQMPAPGTPVERGKYIQVNFSATPPDPLPEPESSPDGDEEVDGEDESNVSENKVEKDMSKVSGQ